MRREDLRDVVLRAMTVDDIPGGLRLCRLSGWNQLDADWRFFLRFNSKRCRVAERCGEVVGTVGGIQYADRFSWLSMLLVHPRERGHGLGTRLLQEGMTALRNVTCCRLDATPAGRQIYRAQSFKEEYSMSRMAGVIDPSRWESSSACSRPMRKSDLGEIASWDLEVFGADRSGLLADLFSRAPEYARVFEGENRIRGYMLGRHGFLYDHLGPIVAEDQAHAEQMIADCVRAHQGKRFVIDINPFAPRWMEWLRAHGFNEERVLFRMYHGEHRYPGLPGHQFAIAGPEFG